MPGVVLAVDDSSSMRQLVKGTLRGAGYEVVSASDGIEALEYARTASVNLVLTDIHMPRMDGIELVKELRNLDSYRLTPILVLTTESGPEMRKRGKEVGATGWIVKPFSPDELLATVKRIL
jgi:two-component system chemotaxis response regulator CheY